MGWGSPLEMHPFLPATPRKGFYVIPAVPELTLWITLASNSETRLPLLGFKAWDTLQGTHPLLTEPLACSGRE